MKSGPGKGVAGRQCDRKQLVGQELRGTLILQSDEPVHKELVQNSESPECVYRNGSPHNIRSSKRVTEPITNCVSILMEKISGCVQARTSSVTICIKYLLATEKAGIVSMRLCGACTRCTDCCAYRVHGFAAKDQRCKVSCSSIIFNFEDVEVINKQHHPIPFITRY